MRVLAAAVIALLGCSVPALGESSLLLARHRALRTVEEPKAEEEAKDDGETHTYKGYEKDWHNEYGNGEVPTWKETLDDSHIPNHEQYEDSQSDGEPSKAR
eukprot:TRINITY_DN97419_c0_g1_i1.p2 TRINITY_DN97419_c0_g1~~TRINITY_DN97419_c0_g1_i1.p2  ORF type:complete len:101 (-),score=30.39 TRINITY_DN97419_c0_g1_i1:147-449(-)